MRVKRSRVLLIATGLAVGGLTSAGVALTAQDPARPTEPVVEESTTEDGQEGEVTVLEEDGDGEDLEDGEAAGVERFWGPECGSGEPTNHGGYVSSTERSGEVRSEAAQSPCGKPLSSLDESDDEGDGDTGEEIETPEVPEEGTEGEDGTTSPQGAGAASRGKSKK